MRTISVYSERANMIGIPENAVSSFCVALSTDIVAVMVRVPKQAIGWLIRRGIRLTGPGPISRAVLEIGGHLASLELFRRNITEYYGWQEPASSSTSGSTNMPLCLL